MNSKWTNEPFCPKCSGLLRFCDPTCKYDLVEFDCTASKIVKYEFPNFGLIASGPPKPKPKLTLIHGGKSKC